MGPTECRSAYHGIVYNLATCANCWPAPDSGERGEIANTDVRYLQTFDTPVALSLRRENAGENGNIEGYYLKGIFAGANEVYRTPFAPARLSDDEIAVATCLTRMARTLTVVPIVTRLREQHKIGISA